MKLDISAEPATAMPGTDTALRNYEDLSEIGQGASGVVFKARDLANEGRFVAIKKFKVHLTEDGGVPASIMREVATLRQLGHYGHNNVIKLLDICNGPRMEREKQLVLYIVFEHMEMDLSEYIKSCPPPGIPSDRIRLLLKHLFCGIDFLHTHRIIHRDLKPQNLLINMNGDLKIADFGLAKLYEAQIALTSVVATLWYRAPEVLLAGSYATPLDMWSSGCIMAELFKGEPIFPGSSEADQLKQIFMVIGTPSENEWPMDIEIPPRSFGLFPKRPLRDILPEMCDAGADLLNGLLKFTPGKRLNALEALNHSFFKDDRLANNIDGIGPDQ